MDYLVTDYLVTDYLVTDYLVTDYLVTFISYYLRTKGGRGREGGREGEGGGREGEREQPEVDLRSLHMHSSCLIRAAAACAALASGRTVSRSFFQTDVTHIEKTSTNVTCNYFVRQNIITSNARQAMTCIAWK